MNIRPVTDLRNKFSEIETIVKEGEPVYLTKNGYGSMVVLSLDSYTQLIDETERMLDDTDRAAEESSERFTHDQAFRRIRDAITD